MCPHPCIAQWILNQWTIFLFKILSLGARAASSKDMSNELEEGAHHVADGWDTGWALSCWWTHPVAGRLLKQDLGLPLTRLNDMYLKMFIQDRPTRKESIVKVLEFLTDTLIPPSPHFLLVDYRHFCRSAKMSLWSHKIKAFWSYIRISRVFAPSYLLVWASVTSGFMPALGLKGFWFSKGRWRRWLWRR